MLPGLIQNGTSIYLSEHAVAPPRGIPRTDDMRAMVEHLRDLGQTRMIPGVLRYRNALLVHPEVWPRLKASINNERSLD